MKKMSKLLGVLALVCLTVCALAITSSARDGNVTVAINDTCSTKTGASEIHVGDDGNSYREYSRARGTVTDNGGTVQLSDAALFVYEFDFMSEEGFASCAQASISPNFRNGSGGSLHSNGVVIGRNSDGTAFLRPLDSSSMKYNFPAESFVWHHVTVIYDLTQVRFEANQATNPTAARVLYFMDGEYLFTYAAGSGSNAPIWQNTSRTDGIRVDNCNGDDTSNLGLICYDNITALTFRKSYTGPVLNLLAAPDAGLNTTKYEDLMYTEDYNYPFGILTCRIVSIDGTVTKYDSFKKAMKAYTTGAEIILERDVEDVTVNMPLTVKKNGKAFTYTAVGYPAKEVTRTNVVTGVSEHYVYFVRGTRFAYYTFLDHEDNVVAANVGFALGIVPDYAPAAPYFDRESGKCFVFDAWKLDGTRALTAVEPYNINSVYTAKASYTETALAAVLTLADGTESGYNAELLNDLFAAGIPAGATLTLTSDVTVTEGLSVVGSLTLDLAGHGIIFATASSPIVVTDGKLTVVSAVAGASVSSSAADALFTLSGAEVKIENVTLTCGTVAAVDSSSFEMKGEIDALADVSVLFTVTGEGSKVTLTDTDVAVRFISTLFDLAGAADAEIVISSGVIASDASSALVGADAASAGCTFTLDGTALVGVSVSAFPAAVEDNVSDIRLSDTSSVSSAYLGDKVVAKVAPTAVEGSAALMGIVGTAQLDSVIAEKTEVATVTYEDGTKVVWLSGEKPTHVFTGAQSKTEGGVLYIATGIYMYVDADTSDALPGATVGAEWLGKNVIAVMQYLPIEVE